jgi:hypothetical protein
LSIYQQLKTKQMNQTDQFESTLSQLNQKVTLQSEKISELITTYETVDISPFSTAFSNLVKLNDERLKAFDFNDWKETARRTLEIFTPAELQVLQQTIQSAVTNDYTVFDQVKFSNALLSHLKDELGFSEVILFRFEQLIDYSSKQLESMVPGQKSKYEDMQGFYSAVKNMMANKVLRFAAKSARLDGDVFIAFWYMPFVRMLLDGTKKALKVLDEENTDSARRLGAILSCVLQSELTEAVLIKAEQRVEF